MADAAPPLSRSRLSPWGWLVAASACVVVGIGLVLGVWWLLSSERRVATYAVRGAVDAVRLDVGNASAEVVGAGARESVEVQRTDVFSFGRRALSERDVVNGVFTLRSRCPRTVLASCGAEYRLSVPDNIPVTVHSSSGDVRLTGFRGSAQVVTRTGNVAVGAFCGFALRARAGTGDVRASTSCAPERLELRSRTGDVHAVVPAGRYRIDADSDTGRRSVRGVTPADDAPFQIQALSSAGDVDVESAR